MVGDDTSSDALFPSFFFPSSDARCCYLLTVVLLSSARTLLDVRKVATEKSRCLG